MTRATRRRSQRAAALWGGLALVVLVAGIGVTVNFTAASAAGNGGTGSAASAGNQQGGGNNGNGIGNAGSTNPSKALTVTATAPNGLAPGSGTDVTARVTNDNKSAVRLTSVTGRITSVTPLPGRSCNAAWYTMAPPSAPLPEVPGQSTRSVVLKVALADATTNQDGCKGASYAFSVSATGEQAST